jgi:hypothetical protein
LERALKSFRDARDRDDEWYRWILEEWRPYRQATSPDRELPDTRAKPRPAGLRGDKAGRAARRYLDLALGDGRWHEMEGMWVLAQAQGIPRRAFETVVQELAPERGRRGFLDEWFVRLPEPTKP